MDPTASECLVIDVTQLGKTIENLGPDVRWDAARAEVLLELLP